MSRICYINTQDRQGKNGRKYEAYVYKFVSLDVITLESALEI